MPTDFSERLPFMMRVVANALAQQLERSLQPFDLTHTQLSALAQLAAADGSGLSGSQLSAVAGVRPQSMSAAIHELVDRRLVARMPHPTHGRIVSNTITPAGRDLLDRAQAATKTVDDRALAQLRPDQQRELKAILRVLILELTDYPLK